MMKKYQDYKKEVIQANPTVFENYEEECSTFKLHHLGDLLREERKKAGLSQEALALRTHTKKSAISRLEKHCEDVKLTTLLRVSKALGKTLELSFQ